MKDIDILEKTFGINRKQSGIMKFLCFMGEARKDERNKLIAFMDKIINAGANGTIDKSLKIDYLTLAYIRNEFLKMDDL